MTPQEKQIVKELVKLLSTEHWAAVKSEGYMHDGGECEICGGIRMAESQRIKTPPRRG